MASRRARTLAQWGFVAVTCALGCATGQQDQALGGLGQGGSDANPFAGTSPSMAGNGAMAGGGAGSFGGAAAGSPSAGTFSSAGTFTNAGTFSASGTSAGGATAGAGGATAGTGGATAGAAGKGGGGAAGSAGQGGSGGGGSVACSAHPIPAKTTWQATASIEAGPCPGMPNPDYCGPASRAIDGLQSPVNMTRYTTGVARAGNEWLQIDFGATVTLSQVVLTTAAGTDYTHGYEVRMSAQAADIATATPIVTGMGQAGVTTITFPATATGQFLRINQTTAIAGWWSIQELDVSCQ